MENTKDFLEKNNENNISEQSIKENIEDKIETKGLKLRKSTKDRLNDLQSKFEDGETMINALLNQYDTMIIESDSKFSDRKGEIDRFNYLVDSLKGAFINSLDMAVFVEEKSNEKFKKEIDKRDKTILTLQETINSIKDENKASSLEVIKKDEELQDVKDSFSRVNLALTTVEKELKEKSDLINNLQVHIKSLGEVINENRIYKEKNEELIIREKQMEQRINELNIEGEKKSYLYIESENQKIEIKTLKESIVNYKEENSKLNNKIQDILSEKLIEISKVNEEKNLEIKSIEKEKNKELKEANVEIANLKDELFKLKLELVQREK